MPIRAALAGVSVILFGISGSSLRVVQPAEPEAAVNESRLENEIKLSTADMGLWHMCRWAMKTVYPDNA